MNIELPKDAEGREIPLDTKVLHDADCVPVSIRALRYNPHECFWRVERLDGLGTPKTTALRLTPPDTWEKLEEDLGRVANCGDSSTPTCAYTRQPCAVCKFHSSENCTSAMCADIESRIHRLRGEGDE